MAWEHVHRNPDETDIVICIPHTGTVRFDWALSYKHLDMPRGHSFISSGNQGQPIHIARNIFVSQALQRKAKYIFFLDSDVEMPHDGLQILRDSNKPIIAGVYSSRSPPYGLSANVNRTPLMPDILDKFPNRIVDVHEIGMGCCLIDMRVIERIAAREKMSWYCMKPHGKDLGLKLALDKTTPQEIMVYQNSEATSLGWKCAICKSSIIADFFKYTVGTGLSAQEGAYSEDYYFCNLVRKVGFPISIHTGVFCNHEMSSMKITKEGLMNPVASAMEI